jgi:hypothetical protein
MSERCMVTALHPPHEWQDGLTRRECPGGGFTTPPTEDRA